MRAFGTSTLGHRRCPASYLFDHYPHFVHLDLTYCTTPFFSALGSLFSLLLFIFTSPFRSPRSNTIIQFAPFHFQHGFFSLYAHLSSSCSTYSHSVHARARSALTCRLGILYIRSI